MNDKPKKTQKNVSKEKAVPGPKGRLLRSKDNRMLWGVAGGLAEHMGLSATLVRAAFIVISLFGGAGVLAYLVLAVALPENDGTGKPIEENVWARLGKVTLVCILVAIALCLAVGLAAVSAWAVASGRGTEVAVIVLALGVGLLAAAFAPGVNRRVTAPLTVLALVLGIPAGAVAAADIQMDGSVGERNYTPTVAADIPAEGYELGTGELVVDLRRLPWANGEAISASATLGIGQMIVSVPENVCIVGHATGKAGQLIVGGEHSHGIDPEVEQGSPTSDAPRLDLDADIQLGQVIVTHDDPDRVIEHEGDLEDYEHERDEQSKVCGR
jgi:phage shock protein PspC (stress-responsive transcriptional regulator)